MNENVLRNEYFNWMCRLVSDERRSGYHRLLKFLDSVIFQYTIPMDGNRADDGIDLRYRFGYENGYSNAEVALYLDVTPCSVLEMMVAMAFRCEEHIMSDPDIGDRTSIWFWDMVNSLGLGDMVNDNFDIDRADYIIDCFLNRKYSRNGEGGLFTVPNCARDMRTVELWAQMNWYLNTVI